MPPNPELGGSNAAARVHHVGWRCSGSMAAGGAQQPERMRLIGVLMSVEENAEGRPASSSPGKI
jgi:hypothetical protein